MSSELTTPVPEKTNPGITPAQGLGRLTAIFTRRIGSKIIGPYLVLIFLMALLGTFVVMRLVSGSLEERFTGNLIDAGRNANDTLVTLEGQNLEALRTIVYTNGVAEAIQKKDAPFLQRALTPIQANNDIDFIDVVGTDGNAIVSLRSRGVPPEARNVPPDLGSWEIVRKVLTGETDAQGDKWSQLVTAPWGGLLLYTAAPAKIGEQVVGTVLVGINGERVISELARNSLSNISIYGPRGDVLGSTITPVTTEAAQPIDPTLYQRIMQSDSTVVQRSLQLGRLTYQEMLGRLELRQMPVAVLGVALSSSHIANAGTETRNQMIILFSFVVLFVLAIGIALARALTVPILHLVQASRRVARGDLETFIPPTTSDETGVLTATFNDMVAGLRDRERIKDTMGKYMSPRVAEAILRGEAKLGGERREVTVLMSDIRGFTTMSEKLQPEELVSLLNGYFERMIDAILEYDGTIDKFIGDAILVYYGAPLYFANHAETAVRTCLRMRESLAEYNLELEERGLPPIRIGIGVNTGFVVAGDIGSSLRKEYTIMGDTVNTTQRVEDLCKEFKTDVLISESTYGNVKDLVLVGEEHEVTVRGRTQQTKIYTVDGMRDAPLRPDGSGRVRTGVGSR